MIDFLLLPLILGFLELFIKFQISIILHNFTSSICNALQEQKYIKGTKTLLMYF
jgi:hypothetical protein